MSIINDEIEETDDQNYEDTIQYHNDLKIYGNDGTELSKTRNCNIIKG